jgi:hypothetical protein
VDSIITLQEGFPFTPQLSYNPSNNGDTRNPVRPFLNPAFTGPVILGNPKQWFDPAAFIAPPATGGFHTRPLGCAAGAALCRRGRLRQRTGNYGAE